MKKLMVLALVIGMLCAADVGAGTLSLEISVGGQPYGGEDLAVGTTVDVLVVQDVPNSMGSGGEVTVTMAASGGLAADTTPTCGWPVAADELSYCCWDWLANFGAAFVDNGDGTWYAWMGKTAGMMSGTPGLGSICGGIPGSPYGSTIAFSFEVTETTELVWGGTWDGVNMNGVVGGTVNVEPCGCYGDVTGDNQVSGGDLAAIVELLIPYAGATVPYTIWPIPAGWDCADASGDGKISGADLSAIVAYLNPAYAGTTPPYTGPCMPSP